MEQVAFSWPGSVLIVDGEASSSMSFSLVVILAPLGPDQSERSKFSLDQSESRIQVRWLIDVTNAHIWAWFYTWPHGIKNTHTQELNPHFSHSFNDRVEPGYKRDVCDTLVTSRPFFALIYIMKIGGLLPGGRGHEQGMRPFDVMGETCSWPWFE